MALIRAGGPGWLPILKLVAKLVRPAFLCNMTRIGYVVRQNERRRPHSGIGECPLKPMIENDAVHVRGPERTCPPGRRDLVEAAAQAECGISADSNALVASARIATNHRPDGPDFGQDTSGKMWLQTFHGAPAIKSGALELMDVGVELEHRQPSKNVFGICVMRQARSASPDATT